MLKMVRTAAATFSMYVVTHLFVFAFLPVAILVSFIDADRISAMKRFFVRCLFALVGKKLRVSGWENVKPGQAYVIVSNYPSFYAGFALIGVFPQASVVAHAFMKRVPLLAQVLGRMGAIFVQPGRSGHGIENIDRGLSAGGAAPSVIILPEGGRTPDGTIQRFRRGFVHIVRQAPLDLLPVTLNGMYRLKPMRRFHADPDAEPELVIHTPVSNSAARQMSDEQLMAMVRSMIGSVYRP